ncbi:hypothetical protein CRYUN_Cryun22dG0124100 [Craigia yunnanensis]
MSKPTHINRKTDVLRGSASLVPVRSLNLHEYLKNKEAKLAHLKPAVLDKPSNFLMKKEKKNEEASKAEMNLPSSSERVQPKNPRWAVYGRGFKDIAEFFNSENYQLGEKKSEGPRKLFTKEEKLMLNRRVPDLAAATSGKWLPLHTLAASGEFYLVDALLKHNVDINAVDKNGLTALHKAIIGKKQAITNYLLRESANPFAHDEDGATLMHYAVNAASTPTIKLLLLYNVDIDIQDNDGWTPLHLAVQGRRTDIVKLLLIRGANKMLKNKDGLTPLDLCLYSGGDTRIYELIKLLKQVPKPRSIMLGAQLCARAVSTFWIFSDQSNAAYPTASSSSSPHSSSFQSSICLHFPTKRRPSPKPMLIYCHSARGNFDPQSRNDDNQDHQFLEASLLISETIVHYRMLRQGFEEDIKWQSSRRQSPMSRAKITSIGQAFLSRFPTPTIFLKISCDGDFLLPVIVVGEFAVENLIAASWGDDNGDSPDQFHLVKNVVKKLGYEPGENDVMSVDARPSDAINVATRCKAPIYVNKQIVLADATRIGYGMGRVRDTKSTYDVLLDSAADGPDVLTEELDLVRNMNLAVKEERYNDAAMLRDKLMKLRNSSHGQ